MWNVDLGSLGEEAPLMPHGGCQAGVWGTLQKGCLARDEPGRWPLQERGDWAATGVGVGEVSG